MDAVGEKKKTTTKKQTGKEEGGRPLARFVGTSGYVSIHDLTLSINQSHQKERTLSNNQYLKDKQNHKIGHE